MPAAAAARTFPEPVRSLPPGTKLDLLPRGTEPERVADWLSGAAHVCAPMDKKQTADAALPPGGAM